MQGWRALGPPILECYPLASLDLAVAGLLEACSSLQSPRADVNVARERWKPDLQKVALASSRNSRACSSGS